MDAMSIRGGALAHPNQMNLGTILPGLAEVVALVDAIRTNAEERALMMPPGPRRDQFLETYVPLSFEHFCHATSRFAEVVGEVADEDMRQEHELQREAWAAEDHELDLQERDLERRERSQREKKLRYEESIDEDAYSSNLSWERHQLFNARENLIENRENTVNRRFTVKNPKFQPKLTAHGLRNFLAAGLSKQYSPTLDDYQKYLRAFNEGYAEAVDSLAKESSFPEKVRNLNTLVVAPNGWGKSELLKQMIYHYVHHNTAGVVILDPLAELSEQVRRWPELVNTDRLVLVDPTQEEGFTVGINPFDARTVTSEEDRKGIASEWAHIIGEVTGDISDAMRRVINNCIRVLLGWHKQATFNDLFLLLGDPEKAPKNPKQSALDEISVNQNIPPAARTNMHRKAELQAFARNYPDMRVQEFFRNDYDTLSVSSTRQALRTRLDLLLQIPYAEAMLTGRQTLDLAKVLDEKKVVVVNLAAFDANANVKVMGGLFLGMLAVVGRRRRKIDFEKRVPVQVVVDEVTKVASPVVTEIITQLRKFRIHMTLAQQVGGDHFTYEQKEALIKCTHCKIIAPVDRDLPKLLGVFKHAQEFEPITKRQFWVKWGDDAEPVRLAVDGSLADRRHEVSPTAFRAHLERGKKAGLYRPAYEAQPQDEAPIEQPVSAPPEDPISAPVAVADEPARQPNADEDVAWVPPLQAPRLRKPPIAKPEAPASDAPAAESKPTKRATKAAKPASSRRTTAGKPKLFPEPETEGP